MTQKLLDQLYTSMIKQAKELGLETDEELIARLIPFMREVAVAYIGKNILIVSHGGVMRTLLVHLGYFTAEDISNVAIKNLAYLKLETDGVDFFIKEVSGVKKEELTSK